MLSKLNNYMHLFTYLFLNDCVELCRFYETFLLYLTVHAHLLGYFANAMSHRLKLKCELTLIPYGLRLKHTLGLNMLFTLGPIVNSPKSTYILRNLTVEGTKKKKKKRSLIMVRKKSVV